MQLFKNLNLLLMFALVSANGLNAQPTSPEKGIYDGKIGNDQLILIAEKAD